MTRPTKLTLDVQTTLVFALAEGATVEHACDYAGIHRDTFYAWLKRGEDGEPAFSDFSDTVTRACGRGIVTDLSTISKAVLAGDWKAAAWRLEHRYPAEYGKKLKIAGDPDHPLTVLHALPDADLDALITRRLREAGYGSGEVGSRERASREDGTPLPPPRSLPPSSLPPSPEEPA